MKIIFTISTIILMISVVSLVCTTGFSPTSLIFNLNVGEKQCQEVSVDSTSLSISIEDKFAENKDIEWKVSNFDKSASYHSLTSTYPTQISNETGKLEYCLSGSKVGEYHGVLILKEEQSGNSIVQMGIWIKATIISSSPEITTSSATTSSGGASSSQSAAVVNSPVENQKTEETQGIDDSNPTITGSAIGNSGIKSLILPLGIVVVLVGILSAYTYYKRRQRWIKFGY
ncbi:MAG: hypothetical protein NT076_04935 [Candidatus Pacearchaeota archaeon]|nr:hypothetical protein [Candidatus Pacearchaeota archaeon]